MLVEREALAREGWDWARKQVQGEMRDAGRGQAVRLAFQSADGKISGAYEAMVEPTGDVIVSRGSCKSDAPHETPVFRVRDFRRTGGDLMAQDSLEPMLLLA